MGVDPWGFDEERQKCARVLRSKRLRLRAVHTIVVGLLAAGLVFGGASALRDVVVARTPPWASLIVFLTILFALFAAVEVPFSYVSGFRWERAHGMSNQTPLAWAKDLAKSLGLGLISTVGVGLVLAWLLASTPFWWIYAWALGVLVSAILGFLAPILLVPLFVRLRPIADQALRSRFGGLAERARVPILGVFEMQSSRKTNRSNAAVMG
ncbi:MAG: hypothetical protein L3J78_00845, partial [Thermoplasmata archaeon]|nr:hypothetical protein [Thermoplasmata archaeon]